MTVTQKHPSSPEFEIGHFRFYRDERGRQIFVPSGPDLDGYLAFDLEENIFVQVRLLKSGDQEKKETYQNIWKRISEENESTICPEIIDCGEEESVPYYVCSLPAGEPVSYFIKRGGPIPPEVAVKMVLKFIRSIKAQNPVSYKSYEMKPETLWIARSPNEPRIILGDISPVENPQAEAANAHLCLDLLKYVSGNPPFNELFQALVTSIGNGPQSIDCVAEKLEEYSEANPPASYWTDFNQPLPLLHQLVPPEVAMQTFAPGSQKQFGEKAPKPRPLWQYLLGIAATAILFGILGTVGLLYMSDGKVPLTEERKGRLTPQTVHSDPGVSVAGENETGDEVVPPGVDSDETSAAEVVSAVKAETPTLLKYPLPELPPIEEAQAGPLKGNEFSNNGILSYRAKSVSTEQTEDTPESYKAPDPAIVSSTGVISSSVVFPTPPPTEEQILLQIANEASEARTNNRILEAIDKEIAYLQVDSKSVEARMRLNGDLFELQQSENRAYSSDDISTLIKATAFNSKAHDLLVSHYRKAEDWNLEIATLVKFGKTGRSDKLREAGERIFQNPSATEDDRKRAREFFIEAAKDGDSDAQFFAGECMILGRGGDKDLPQGTYYLRKAISQSDGRAMDLLGVCYVRGWGVRRDDSEAVKLFQMAIENGNIPAFYNLGARYAQGQGVERDPSRAADIFGEGSAKGNAHCMLVYGRCFEAGYGREQNHEKAVYWFAKSAEQGNAEAIKWCADNSIDYLKVLAES